MKRINILYCIEYLSSGGTEKQLISLINSLDRNKFKPHLCCLRNSMIGKYRRAEAIDFFARIECPKIQLDFISLRNLKSFIDIVKLIQFIKKYEIDIIQTYFQDPAIIGLIAAKLSGVKNVIASFRDLGFWREDENDFKMKLIYKLCSNYIANSLAVKGLYGNLYNLPDEKIAVIYNGIDVAYFKPNKRDRKDGKNSKEIIVGIVANFNREVKRVDIFLKAAAYVLQRFQGLRFVIAGDGELKKELIKLSEELGISRDVEFLGRVENIPHVLSTIDIGVVSSDSEGFSNTILEYMAAGVPVVATDVGGNREIIENGISGFLVPRGDYRALGERIMELANKKNLYNKIRKIAFEVVCKDYTLGDCIHKYENYYEQMMVNEVNRLSYGRNNTFFGSSNKKIHPKN